MRTNRKALLSGYTDLQFSGLLVVVLLLFGILMYGMHESASADVLHDRVAWEHGWLANAITNHPVQRTGEPLGQALANNLPAQQAAQELDAIIDRTQLTDQTLAVFVLRGGELIYCETKRRPNPSGIPELNFPCGGPDPTPPSPIARAVSANLGVGLLDARAARARNEDAMSWSITPGKNRTVIGVVTS